MSVRTVFLPELETARGNLFRAAAAKGVQLAIADFGGYRTAADTALILKYRDDDYAQYAATEKAAGRIPIAKEKWRRIAPFGSSFHDYAAAFDVEITARPKTMTNGQALELAAALAPGVGLRNGKSFDDIRHFELPITLADARQRYSEFQSHTGRYAPAGPQLVELDGGNLENAGDDDTAAADDITDDAGGDDTSSSSSSPAGSSAIIGILVAVAIGAAVIVAARHAGGAAQWR